MEPVTRIESATLVIDQSDIDTDQIIPARFLTTTSKEGLGEALFADWRFREDGSENPDFVLNDPENAGRTILVAGNNFGCGSSREHAAWALADYGIRAVISTEIADIFRSNALKNGLLPVDVPAELHRWLLDHPGANVVLDLESNTLTLPDGRAQRFRIEAFARYCLMQGTDQLGFLLSQEDAIARFETTRPWKP
ncbi:3-isopropylmalate dehydratase small subunit [Lentisalinibacter sediminis]|uniref:3-isopropylmalate dehydratase small subunit n=1 Tax=Lentisalinibacter sediminis TaxID=2992237 RepID=UPI003865EFD0